jgi:hypothetical protein
MQSLYGHKFLKYLTGHRRLYSTPKISKQTYIHVVTIIAKETQKHFGVQTWDRIEYMHNYSSNTSSQPWLTSCKFITFLSHIPIPAYHMLIRYVCSVYKINLIPLSTSEHVLILNPSNSVEIKGPASWYYWSYRTDNDYNKKMFYCILDKMNLIFSNIWSMASWPQITGYIGLSCSVVESSVPTHQQSLWTFIDMMFYYATNYYTRQNLSYTLQPYILGWTWIIHDPCSAKSTCIQRCSHVLEFRAMQEHIC